jgi:hexosaminidase
MKIKLILGMAALSVAASVLAANEPQIIPLPQNLTRHEGFFKLAPDMRIYTDPASIKTGVFLAGQLHTSTGWRFQIRRKTPDMAVTDGILLTTNGADARLGAEGYELTAITNTVVIRAPSQAGLFYGVQTLLQLLPPEIFSKGVVRRSRESAWEIPCVTITDQPRFPWRGMHLDVGRHFFSVAEVKKFLDYAAMLKMNVFHWHLTEDQGWRIEIKKYPKLAKVGSIRASSPKRGSFGMVQDGVQYGPFFYSQDQIREVVTYAAERHIEVIPEIEMPGHSMAALTAYPELGCTGGPYKVRTNWGVSEDVFCAGNEQTYKFLEGVIDEVCELFPSRYIHIGGDECPKTRWNLCPKCQARIKAENLKDARQLQSYFVTRVEKYVNGKGKRIIGWDEIMEGGLAPNATVMVWHGTNAGIAVAKAGHDVIMTPFVSYFCQQESDGPNEPEGQKGPVTLSAVYHFDPSCGLNGDALKHILGSEGCCWSEYFQDFKMVEYNIHPRMSALAEVLWTPKKDRNFDNFKARLSAQIQRLKAMGSNYRDPAKK